MFCSWMRSFLWAIPEWISKERGWSFVSNWKFNHVMPFKVLIPLDKAAKLYYEEVTRINHADIINALDDNVLTGRDMRLDFMAAQLADGAQLYGRRPLSRLIQPLSFDSTPTIGMNGSSIVDNSQKPVYTDLKIERRHFKNKMNSLTCKTK